MLSILLKSVCCNPTKLSICIKFTFCSSSISESSSIITYDSIFNSVCSRKYLISLPLNPSLLRGVTPTIYGFSSFKPSYNSKSSCMCSTLSKLHVDDITNLMLFVLMKSTNSLHISGSTAT